MTMTPIIYDVFYYFQGCYDAIHDKLDEYSKIAMGIAAGIAFIEVK